MLKQKCIFVAELSRMPNYRQKEWQTDKKTFIVASLIKMVYILFLNGSKKFSTFQLTFYLVCFIIEWFFSIAVFIFAYFYQSYSKPKKYSRDKIKIIDGKVWTLLICTNQSRFNQSTQSFSSNETFGYQYNNPLNSNNVIFTFIKIIRVLLFIVCRKVV